MGPPQEPEEEGIPWGRYIAALRRFKYLILTVTLVGTAVAAFATRFLKPEYTARATIWIEPPPSGAGPIRAPGLLQSHSWAELLTTGVVLDSVAVNMELYLTKDPADSLVFEGFSLSNRMLPGQFELSLDAEGKRFMLRTIDGIAVDSGVAGDSIGRPVGFRWAPTSSALGRSRTIKFKVISPRDASLALQSTLSANMAQDGNFLHLRLTGSNPSWIANTLNAVADQFVTVAAELKRSKLQILTDDLQKQVAVASRNLRIAENRLESYRIQIITEPNEGTPIRAGLQTQMTVVGSFFNQKVKLDEIKQDRSAMEEALRRGAASGTLSVDAFQLIPSVRSAPDLMSALQELTTAEAELRALRYRYTDEHKPVRDLQERINTLRTQTIPAYTRALSDQLRVEEQTLESRIGVSSEELERIPSRSIHEQRLNREKLSAENLYQMLSDRYEEAKLALASAIPDVRLLDRATIPSKPSSNSAPRIILMGFLASFGAAIGLAILLDQLDKRFRYPEQVTKELGLSILGAIPAIRKVEADRRDPEEASQVVEAFRTVRLNLAHSYGAAGPIQLTVSSPGPGDGKSLVSSNLALSFAEAGYRTVLIDGDIRRGELHRMFGMERRPGLIDHLAGDVTLEEVLRTSTHDQLTVVPCGTRQHHGPELLGSARMSELMAALKSRFDVIIVDSPPLGAGIDPFVLGTTTGHMMVVLRSGETDRQMAEAKLRLLDRLPIRLLGAVLNDIRTHGIYQYYSYVYGYSADADAAPVAQLAGGPAEAESEDEDFAS